MQAMPHEFPGTPWHIQSYDRFLQEYLPRLLAERLPLAAYHVDGTGSHSCSIQVRITGRTGDVSTTFTGVPYPDVTGVFYFHGCPYVVIPYADSFNLEQAAIASVGEQLDQYVAERLGTAPADLPWDLALLNTWLPINSWIDDFLTQNAQPLDETNWVSAQTHLRRLIIDTNSSEVNVIGTGHLGRVCPVDTPEGSKCGRVVTITRGAVVEKTRLVVKDSSPEQGLGIAASLIPFLENDDPARALIGTTLMRQFRVPTYPEPALVRTGNEPTTDNFWTGRNLLTAFISWGEATFGDGIVISESAARRLSWDHDLCIGDKLANRHGSKGVVSLILPDAEMPHLEDGTPVELLFSFIGLHTRLNNGQQLEAVAGRIAQATGVPFIAPPFAVPKRSEIRSKLADLGLPTDGMEQLYLGQDGQALECRSLIGWVYWGLVNHLAKSSMRVFTNGPQGQMMGRMEYAVLHSLGAYDLLGEQLNTRSPQHPEANTLPARIASGSITPAEPPTPAFAQLKRRLAIAGIQINLNEECLTFDFAIPCPQPLRLAMPVPHPWIPERTLTEVGLTDDIPGYQELHWTNNRLGKLLDSGSPESLIQQAKQDLTASVRNIFAALVQPDSIQLRGSSLFSGRAVIAPVGELEHDQAGLPEDMAWALFGPLVIQELGIRSNPDAEQAVATRSQQAQEMLDKVMTRSWVVVNKAPTLAATAILAFRPVRVSGYAIRVCPMVCDWLNADFDGDQVAVFLPITTAGQLEAAHRLSVVAHLERDPNLLDSLLPTNESLWGLAWHNLTKNNQAELQQLIQTNCSIPTGYLNKFGLSAALSEILRRDGAAETVTRLSRIWRLGFNFARLSGASLCPMAEQPVRTLPINDEMEIYSEVLLSGLAACSDFTASELGPQLLAIKSGARGHFNQLALLVGGGLTATNPGGERIPVFHGYLVGLTSTEWVAMAADTWRRFVEMVEEFDRTIKATQERKEIHDDYGVLARARRAKHPGVVFAQAAAHGETDPLIYPDSRLFVGLRVR